MLQKLQNHIKQNLPFLNGKKLLLAVSGGIDSMVLVDLFAKLNFEIAIAHCNFQLRGKESDEDEAFVKVKSEKLKVKSHFQCFETKEYAENKKLSIQQAARELRYNWFNKLLETQGFDYVLTAHHLDDSLETFLINFTRGTGLDGLLGIPQVNDAIVRPLLIFSREEIENYTQENQIEWREDSSNASDKYFRNKIRHNIVPVLKELNPNLLDSFQNTIQNLNQTQSLIKDAVEFQYKNVVSKNKNEIIFDVERLKSLNNYTNYLYQWLKDYGFQDWESVYDLVENQSGKQVFSEKYRLLKDRNSLILTTREEKNTSEFQILEDTKSIELPIKLEFCNQSYISDSSKSVIFVDKEKLKFPLILRKWQEGDYFYPAGMQGKKKVSKYFKDEKFSLIDKENTWLLCSENEIVWIINHRADNRFIANTTTQQIVKIAYIK